MGIGKKMGLKDWNEQDQRIPALINIARIAIVLSLLVFQVVSRYINQVSFPPIPFDIWAVVYGLIIILTAVKPDWQWQSSTTSPTASAVVDVSMIMLLVYIAGGITSGLGILIMPFVAASCLLSRGRYSMLYASYTTMLVLLMMFLNGKIQFNPLVLDPPTVTAAALLIGGVYLVAAVTAFAATRLQAANESASMHQLAYKRVNGLNRLVLNRVQEAVIVIDGDQKVWLFNPQAKTYFPTLEIDGVERGFNDLVKQWQRQPDKVYETDIHIQQHAVRVRAVPLIQDDIQLLMLYVRSIREVAADAMAIKLASLGQLTANLAHEIRNPMSAVRHANDLLREDNQDPTQIKLHGIIDSNIQRIDKMLEDISLLNKRDGVNREPIELADFWLSFKQEFTLNNPDAVGCLTMEAEGENLTVMTDAIHLQQILWNLCNNTWRHSKQDKQAITVKIRPSGKLNMSVLVIDNGAGVPPELRERLFEPFFTTAKQGTGLGLYVARELAHANFGQLHYLPEVNGFELILPRDANDYDI